MNPLPPARPGAPARGDRRFVLPETTLLALIGCLDLVTTMFLISSGQAWEANPLMAPLLRSHGPGGLILGKVFLLAGPLVIAEAARKRNPAFVRTALRVGIALYLVLYFIGFTRLNPGG
jgi:hypothetical protein